MDNLLRTGRLIFWVLFVPAAVLLTYDCWRDRYLERWTPLICGVLLLVIIISYYWHRSETCLSVFSVIFLLSLFVELSWYDFEGRPRFVSYSGGYGCPFGVHQDGSGEFFCNGTCLGAAIEPFFIFVW